MTQLLARKLRLRSGPLTTAGPFRRVQRVVVSGIVFAMVALALAPAQASGGSSVARHGETISLDFQGVPLATALALLRQNAQIEVSVPPSALQKLVTVRARKLPVDKALAKLFESASLKNYAIFHGADSKDWIYVIASEGSNPSAVSQAPTARTLSPTPPAQTFTEPSAAQEFSQSPDAQPPDGPTFVQAPFVQAPTPEMAARPQEETSGGTADFIQTSNGPVQRLPGYAVPSL